MEVLEPIAVEPIPEFSATTSPESDQNASNRRIGTNSAIPAVPSRVKYKPRGSAFTKETAQTNALKAIKARESNKKHRAEIARQVALEPINLALERAEMCAEQITRTHEALKKDDLEPRERAQLLTAMDRLLERERVLRGIPNPGSYRPSKPRTEQSSSDATPL